MGLKGYTGSVLRVDLDGRKWEVEDTENYPVDKFLGGRGLGSKLLFDMTDASTEPLSPENPLMFLTGPYTGTPGISSAFYNVTTKAPLTRTPSGSHSGGFWGPHLKRAGFDAIIIEGRADEPVYITVDNGEVSIESAKNLWGKGVFETTDYLESRYPGSRVAVIGPAGENLVWYASIMNDKYRAVGRTGAGAVMGSKLLKAIVVRGKRKVEVADPKGLKDIYLKALSNTRVKAAKIAELGTPAMIPITNSTGTLPTRNFQQGRYEKAENLDPKKLRYEFTKKKVACYGCPIRCSNFTEAEYGGLKVEGEGPEYETTMAFGSNIDNDDYNLLIVANALCNDYGMDTVSAGDTIAFFMELYERGIISRDEVDGYDLRFGNREIIPEILGKIARREGVGKLMSLGVREASSRIGRNSERYAIHVKGLEPPGYDPRGSVGMGLNYATSNRGACHLRAAMYVPELLYKSMDRLQVRGKEEYMARMQNILAVIDSMVMCKFGSRYGYLDDPEEIGRALTAVTGTEFSGDDILRIGDRIWNMERLYLLREGYTREDDTLPDRFFEEPVDVGEDIRAIDREEFHRAIENWYLVRGWDVDGRPTPEKLEELGLEEYLDKF